MKINFPPPIFFYLFTQKTQFFVIFFACTFLILFYTNLHANWHPNQWNLDKSRLLQSGRYYLMQFMSRTALILS
jgi:hypothetical protein